MVQMVWLVAVWQSVVVVEVAAGVQPDSENQRTSQPVSSLGNFGSLVSGVMLQEVY